MKKIFIIFSVLSMLFGIGASADDAPDAMVENTYEQLMYGDVLFYASNNTITDAQGIVYEITSDGVKVAGYTVNVAVNIEIPPTLSVEGYTYWVTEINDCAFQNNNSIRSIKTGYNIRKIGNLAFDNCSVLETVEINALSLAETGNAPFRNCPKLEEINLLQSNDKFKSINGVFYGKAKDLTDNQKLKTAIIAYPPAKDGGSYTVADDTELVAAWAFGGCKKLESIIIPASVKTVDGYAFDKCISLKNVDFSGGTEVISDGAFNSCELLETIQLPKSIKKIGTRPFFGCDNMKSVAIENEYFTVYDGVVYTKDKTELVYYPPKLELTEYTIPNGVKIIRSGAFFRAYNIKKLILPDSVEKIEEYGIRSCTAMTECNLSSALKTMGKECISFCTSLTKLIIPNGVKSIPDKAFRNCTLLSEIHIPQSVVSISENAFENCADVSIYGEDESFADKYAKVQGYDFIVTDVRIKFVTNCADTLNDKVYPVNTLIEVPEGIKKNYFTFEGWYTDNLFTQKWDFLTTADKSMKLYAKWDPVIYKLEFKDDKLSLTPSDDNPKKVFVASYDENGRMTNVIMRDASETISFNELNGAFEIRAFLWSGLDSVVPLCERAIKDEN